MELRHNIAFRGGIASVETAGSERVEERRANYRVSARASREVDAGLDPCWGSPETARRTLQAFADSLRFPYFRLSLCVSPGPLHALERCEIGSFPEAWIEHYRRNGYARFDPTLALLHTTVAPFAWHEADRRGAEAEAFFAAVEAHGLVDGFTVPLRGGNGESVCLTLAGRSVPADASERTPLYQATYVFLCGAFGPLRALHARHSTANATEPLTEKQRQIMILLMQGMGVKSIARALNIHSRTVDDGLRRACARLGAKSREQAIVRALELRQVELSACAPATPLGTPRARR